MLTKDEDIEDLMVGLERFQELQITIKPFAKRYTEKNRTIVSK